MHVKSNLFIGNSEFKRHNFKIVSFYRPNYDHTHKHTNTDHQCQFLSA